MFVSACKKPPYKLEYGVYGFEYATMTNRITKEVSSLYVDEMFNNDDKYDKWKNFLDFLIKVDEETEYFFKKDNRCYVLNEGLAFEVINEKTLQLHFPFWSTNDYCSYDVVIMLSPHTLYV